MLIARKPSGELCFSCAECFWTVDALDHLDDWDKGYQVEMNCLAAPTYEEIRAAGWAKYCTHSLGEDYPEGPDLNACS